MSQSAALCWLKESFWPNKISTLDYLLMIHDWKQNNDDISENANIWHIFKFVPLKRNYTNDNRSYNLSVITWVN